VDIRSIIVDDEEPAREEVKSILEKFSDIKIVGVFEDAISAFNFISNNPVDVVFLDINLPGVSGLKLADQLKEFKNFPFIVFITAYSEYAVEAFEIGAVDYILKPIEETRLAKTILKLKNFISSKSMKKDDFVVSVVNGEMLLLKLQDISYFFVEQGKLFAKKGSNEYLIKGMTLQEVEDRFKNSGFFRINKEYVINLSKVLKIIPWFKGKYTIQMDNGDKLPLSPHRQKEFREIFKF